MDDTPHEKMFSEPYQHFEQATKRQVTPEAWPHASGRDISAAHFEEVQKAPSTYMKMQDREHGDGDLSPVAPFSGQRVQHYGALPHQGVIAKEEDVRAGAAHQQLKEHPDTRINNAAKLKSNNQVPDPVSPDLKKRINIQHSGHPFGFTVDARYTNLAQLGRGNSGYVFSALDTRTGNQVAIKKVSNIFRDIGEAKRVLRELKLLRHFRGHENIVTVQDMMMDPHSTQDFRDIYIVTNLYEADLGWLIKSSQHLTDRHYKVLLYQILRGLKYIHSASVLHRDLKPVNLLINSECHLAICDFGMARGIGQEGEGALTQYVVTRWYRAPELLCNVPKYGKEIDMWSVGCIFAEMMRRKACAFLPGKSPLHQLRLIFSQLGCPSNEDARFMNQCPPAMQELAKARDKEKRGADVPSLASHFAPGTNPQALDLLARLLCFNPARRISVSEALEHPYLHDFHANLKTFHEPGCPTVFQSNLERGLPLQRNIPLQELRQLMWTEMTLYKDQGSSKG